jgi:hypothetical protein
VNLNVSTTVDVDVNVNVNADWYGRYRESAPSTLPSVARTTARSAAVRRTTT